MDGVRDGYFLPKSLQTLARWSPARIVALSVVVSIFLGIIDWVTGPLFSFTIFYLVPVALVAWLVGRRAAVFLSLFCAVVWTVADAEPWHSSFPPVLDLWNAAVRLGFFLLVTWALATTRRALESQNRLARRVQMGLLRSRLPADGPVEVAASWRPAQAVSGDFYFVDQDPSGGIVACIADVSGKGVGPALLMANVQAALETSVEAGAGPGALCRRLNQFLTRHAADGQYVTFFAIRLEVSAGRASYCNAGHNPPLLVRAAGPVEWLKGGGPVLGVFPDREFEEHSTPLTALDRLVLFTDGVTETWNAAGEEFGYDRIVTAARGAGWAGAEETQHRILDALEAFAHGNYHDDVTTLILTVKPNGGR
jgi:sigma-B regulation protein RsbU (phosphoserine phosphatase)